MTKGYNDPLATVLGKDPCDELELLGAIWKFDKNRLNQTLTDGEKYSTGVRSVVGISWNNEVDQLYAVNHGRDYLFNHAPKFYSEWDNAVQALQIEGPETPGRSSYAAQAAQPASL